MDAVIVPGKQCDRYDMELVQALAAGASSLEGLLAGVFDAPGRRLTFIRVHDEHEDSLLGIVRFERGSEVFVSIPRAAAIRRRTLFHPADGVKKLADSTEAVIDEEWLEKRDRDFGIRSWQLAYRSETGVRPSRAVDVILSYALSPFGEATISRGLYDSEHRFGIPGLYLALSYLGAPDAPGMGETMWVDWLKFTALGAKRGASRGVRSMLPPGAAPRS